MDIDTLRARLDEATAQLYAAKTSRQRLMDALPRDRADIVTAYLLGAVDDRTWTRAVAYALATAGA